MRFVQVFIINHSIFHYFISNQSLDDISSVNNHTLIEMIQIVKDHCIFMRGIKIQIESSLKHFNKESQNNTDNHLKCYSICISWATLNFLKYIHIIHISFIEEYIQVFNIFNYIPSLSSFISKLFQKKFFLHNAVFHKEIFELIRVIIISNKWKNFNKTFSLEILQRQLIKNWIFIAVTNYCFFIYQCE